MKPDPFEEQLRHQPLRPVPPAWRDEILAAARRAARPQEPALAVQSVPWWRKWLWPCPQAWAGLAAVWIILLGLRIATPATSASAFAKRPSSSPEAQLALAAQRREIARLLDGPLESTPVREPAVPGPRSERRSPYKA